MISYQCSPLGHIFISSFHKVPKISDADYENIIETSNSYDGYDETEDASALQTEVEPQPLTIMKAR